MANILITGANRGLGLEFCRQYAEAGERVFACCRQPETARELQALAELHSNLTVHTLDVADFGQVDALARELSAETIDLLLNNAGVYGDQSGHGFGNLDYAVWEQTLRVNTLAPVKVAEAFLPHLKKSRKPILAAVSSLMGSMADNRGGGSLLYRSSKAGLNAAMKSLSIDLNAAGIAVLILHPGWVKTDMGGSSAPTPVQESVGGMFRVITEFGLDNSGAFLNFRGEVMPW